jgi:YjbE family integral membrane protein
VTTSPFAVPSFDAAFLASVLGIILIDLILAGDNAVVIAMAVKNLPPARRRQGILLGAGAAVALRVIATFFVAQLLSISLLKAVGGAAVAWIGVKLYLDAAPARGAHAPAASLWHAVWMIVVADITLSIDNMLAVGGASHGDLFLLIFGLIVSVPFVVLASNALSSVMVRYPVVIAFGAAVLGKVSMEMTLTDPFVAARLPLGPAGQYGMQALGAIAVLAAGQLLIRRSARRAAAFASDDRLPARVN